MVCLFQVVVVAGVEEHAARQEAEVCKNFKCLSDKKGKRQNRCQKTSEHVDINVVAEAQLCTACRRVVGCGADEMKFKSV